MGTEARRVLYLDGYTVPDPRAGVPSSDAIGYGITASGSIARWLGRLGFDVSRPVLDAPAMVGAGRGNRLAWILATYGGVLRSLIEDPPDAIFAFHAFTTFPVEIRRMLLDLGLSIPVVGYTHGSHWDPTDTFRFQAYPGMELVDLANLHVLDRVLLVSEYMRATLRANIGALSPGVAEQLDAKAVVVGLPLDVERIDACRGRGGFEKTTVVFNHAPVASKNPDLFVRVMTRVLPRYDIAVLFSRNLPRTQPGGAAVSELADRFPQQVLLGRDMPLDDYYAALWAADLQVSTATHESLGVSTLEAMYTGNCCILPNLGSYPEICDGHPDVLYELSEGGLEDRLCYFLDHPEHRLAVAADLQRLANKYHPLVVVPKVAAAIAGSNLEVTAFTSENKQVNNG